MPALAYGYESTSLKAPAWCPHLPGTYPFLCLTARAGCQYITGATRGFLDIGAG